MILQKKIKKELKDIQQKFIQYFRISRIFFFDSIYRYKLKVFLILVSGLIHTWLKIQAIALAVFYARSIEKNSINIFFEQEIEPRKSILLLVFFSFSILISLALSALLGYFSKIKILKLWRKYDELCTKRALILISSNLRIWSSLDNCFYDEVTIRDLVSIDTRQCGRVLGMSLSMITPLITFIVSVIAVFYINIYLTLILGFFMLIAGGFMYKINHSAVKYATLNKKYTKERNREYKELLNYQKSIFIPYSNTTSWINAKLFELKGIKSYLDSFEGRLKVLAESELISNFYFAIGTTLIISILGSQVLLKGEGWGQLIVYLIAARQGLQNFGSVSKKITSINRYYPHFRRYFNFLEDAKTCQYNKNYLPQEYLLEISEPLIPESLKRVNLSKGIVIGLITPIKLHRYSISLLMNCLSADLSKIEILNSLYLATKYYNLLLGSSFREILEFPDNYNYNDFLKDIKDLSFHNEIQSQLPSSLEENLNLYQIENITDELKICLALISAVYSDAKFVLIDGVSLNYLTDTTQNFLLDKLSEKKTIFIVFNKRIDQVGKYKEDLIAVTDSKQLLGIGDNNWFIKNKETINSYFNKDSNSSADDLNGDALEDQDDFDEM